MSAARRICTTLLSTALCVGTASSQSDSVDATCAVYPEGADQPTTTIPCRFYQSQGHVEIRRSDGIVHDLKPTSEAPGTYTDPEGNAAYRQSGLGDRGLIFRLSEESVFVYWDTGILDSTDHDSPTAPFAISDYDATAIFRCRAAGEDEFGSCPGGIMRMEDKQASVTVQNQSGEQFTINFMTDYVNATNRELEAELEGDTWILKFADGEIWEVPLAAIEGG